MTHLSDEEVVAGRHDLEMMRRPHLWPHEGVLPLKQRQPAGSVHHLLDEQVVRPYAVLSYMDGLYYVAEGTIFGRTGRIQSLYQHELPRLVEQGWVVD